MWWDWNETGFIVSIYKLEFIHGETETGKKDMEKEEDGMGMLLLILQQILAPKPGQEFKKTYDIYNTIW